MKQIKINKQICFTQKELDTANDMVALFDDLGEFIYDSDIETGVPSPFCKELCKIMLDGEGLLYNLCQLLAAEPVDVSFETDEGEGETEGE